MQKIRVLIVFFVTSAMYTSHSSGHQVDGVPLALSTETFWGSQGPEASAPIGDFGSNNRCFEIYDSIKHENIIEINLKNMI